MRSKRAVVLLVSASLLGLTVSTGCMPLFPPPGAPSPRLNHSQVRDLLKCEDRITLAGKMLVTTQIASVEECALDILHQRLLYENELISEDEFDNRLDAIRDKCNKGFGKVARASNKFMDSVIDACDSVGDLILEDYDSLRFQLLEEEAGSAVDVTSISALAGSLCGIKSLFVNQLIAVQIPRALELFSYLGPAYIVIVGENDFEYGYINVALDERCRIPET